MRHSAPSRLVVGLLLGIMAPLVPCFWCERGCAQQVPLSNPLSAPPGTRAVDVLPLGMATSTPNDGLLPDERVNIAVYEKCNRSVVHISTKSASIDSLWQVTRREGTGSGSVIDRNGLILTNHHVVDGARSISASLSNGLSYSATLVGQDPDTDIAIIKIDAPEDQLIPIELADATPLRVGQKIYAIGNPFGLERTMSTGMISSLNRQFPSSEKRMMRSLIQIDASINQGNSGGPLLNTRGQLIGMNTAIISSSGDSAGVGFAIPVSTIARIVPQLLEHGQVTRASIGITKVFENDRGLLIVFVTEGGPAEQAGLRGFGLITKTIKQGLYTYYQNELDTSQADLITAVDGQDVRTADDLLARIEDKQPGEVVMLTVLREGTIANIPVVLGRSN